MASRGRKKTAKPVESKALPKKTLKRKGFYEFDNEKEKILCMLLRHRFGINNQGEKNLSIAKEFPTEDLFYETAFEEIKKSHKLFIDSSENVEKLTNHIQSVVSRVQTIISDAEIRIQYRININELIQVVDHELNDIGATEYLQKMPSRIDHHQMIVAPVRTKKLKADNNGCGCQVKGIAFFGDKLLKFNRGDRKIPAITIYKIQKFDEPGLTTLVGKYFESLKEPLEQKTWDTELNELLNLEKINRVIKKEHAIGSCAWLTNKMFIYAIVYGIIFQSLKELGAKEIIANKIAFSIAEGWYKLFTIDDRNHAVQEYLDFHHFENPFEPLSVENRVNLLKTFLSQDNLSTYKTDNALLTTIYLKSLNWLLAEYLNKGEIAKAQELIKSEENNPAFNPLFYAARNDKRAIAELISNNSRFVNDQDEFGNTPLMVAVNRGQYDISKTIMRRQKKNLVDLRQTNHQGYTVLHIAVMNNDLDLAEYFLELDKELLNMKSNEGKTPKMIAEENESHEMIKLLKL